MGRYRALMDTDDLARLFALIALAAIVLSGVVVVCAVGLRFAGRRPGRRWGTAVAFLFGIQLGVFILFAEGDAIQRAFLLAVVGALTLGLLWRDRRVQAGAFLAGAALPWTAVWGYYAFQLVQGVPAEPYQTWTLFALGIAPTLIGLGLMAVGDPLPPDPRHREVFAIAASAGFVVTASLADANLRIWQPLSNICTLVPLQAAPQWLNFTGYTLTVGLTTGPISFSVR